MTNEMKFRSDEMAPANKKHWRTYTNKEFLIGEMIPDNGILLTLKNIQKEELQNPKGKEEKPVLYFEETKLKIVANKTNLEKISEVLESPFPVDWIGRQIHFIPVKKEFFGKIQTAIRIGGGL